MTLAIDGHAHFTTGSNTAAETMSLQTNNSGDWIFLAAQWNGALTISSITDNSGVTSAWAEIGTIYTAYHPMDVWLTKASAPFANGGSAATITVNFSGGTGNFLTMDAWGVSGADTAALDILGSCSCTAAGTLEGGSGYDYFNASSVGGTAADPMSITTTNANDMVLACYRVTGAGSGGAVPPNTTGWSNINGTGNGADYSLIEYLNGSSAGSYTAALQSGDAGTTQAGVMFAVKAAGGGGAPYNPWPQLGPLTAQHHKSFSGWRGSFERQRFERRSPRGLILPHRELLVPKKRAA